jgi:glycosyltransferase involved in cell wall biosynthesis
VAPGRNGLLVAARDAAALAEGMLQMLAERGRLEHMGHESRAITEDLFDIHMVNRAILGAMGLD